MSCGHGSGEHPAQHDGGVQPDQPGEPGAGGRPEGHDSPAQERLLGEELVEGDPRAPHLWLPLPEPWSTGGFVNAARAAGVLVSPGDDYVTDRTTPALGARIGLNMELDDDALRTALGRPMTTLRTGPSSAPLG